MENTCQLRSKCLKEDKSLEECNNVECQNVIHLSCFKKLVATFGENEWEGPLFCGKQCFNHHKKSLKVAASKDKGRLPGQSDGLAPEINSMAVMIDRLTTSGNYSQWHGSDKEHGTLVILDADESKANEVDDNKPIEVDTPRLKRTTEEVPTLKKKLRTSQSSLSWDLTELLQLKREQMLITDKYKIRQFGLEERKLKLLEQELTMKMEILKVEVEQELLKFKVDLLRKRLQLHKEGVSQDEIDSAYPIVNDYAKGVITTQKD